nr:response regulator [uncultured Pseudomonas sp.]
MAADKVPILVIEDDTATQTLVQDVLLCSGYACTTVASAEEGMRLLETFTPALILLDINLPGMDGVTTARQLKGSPQTRSIKLIGMSAHALVSELSQIETADFDDFITKPFSYKVLLQLIESQLAKP